MPSGEHFTRMTFEERSAMNRRGWNTRKPPAKESSCASCSAIVIGHQTRKWCDDCLKVARKVRWLAKRSQMTLVELVQYILNHDDKCDVCGEMSRDHYSAFSDDTKRRLNIDHNHQTGFIRGMLCTRCNFAIGLARDDPVRLRALADYLEKECA